MPKTTFIGTPQSRVAAEPVRPGSVIFTDEHRLYWDSPQGVRYEVADILELESEVARQAITKPLNKFYYVLSTNTLYRYNNGWKNLSVGGGSSGGGGDPTPSEPFELTLDKLIPFASNSEPQPLAADGSPGTAGEYARADHVHPFSFANMSFDCGYFSAVSPPSQIDIHNLSLTTHPYLIIDGNVFSPSRSDYPDLASHQADPMAHSDMVLDGNDLTGSSTPGYSLPLHSIDRHAHPNIRIDGNLVVGQ